MFLRKIFLNDCPLILTTRPAAYLLQHPEAGDFAHYEGASSKHFKAAAEQLENGDAPGILLSDAYPNKLLEALAKRYKQVDAGGGLVQNEDGATLFIFRRGRWDLPKGKLDKGETMEECAIREVQEETGLKRLVLGNFLCDTYHVYGQGGKEMLKHTAWYAMGASGRETLLPQADEDIEEARWVLPADVARIAAKSYAAIREVVAISS